MISTLTSQQIRQQFMDFFASKQHAIVPSSPMVIKDDPTLMFTNAGMNQFKDIFLGNRKTEHARVANSQKCLRVSGKHNDLEEVGHDTYHHTMFEMLGNWSFGDYFKEEAIAWAWELLTGVFGLDETRLYGTVFKGDEAEGLEEDNEAKGIWQRFLPDDRILFGNKKDNFWEMGDTGPCGPCSEIHFDLRDDKERRLISGAGLVNTGHPLVIEIWNLVFIQFNRLSDGSLQPLPMKHVDTGMGFERLCMALQGKSSNYDTDIFQPILRRIGQLSGKSYGPDPKDDVAFRVVADHLRAVAFSIADGRLPSNVKAGYVIRRILRRAIRYGFTYLGFHTPSIHLLVPELVEVMGDSFPELKIQQSLIMKVIAEEEISFLRTLETGMQWLDQITLKLKAANATTLDGETAFLLYDTYGFPVDLTALILAEHGMTLDTNGFEAAMQQQKNRSRDAAKIEAGDWVSVNPSLKDEGFVGYDFLETEIRVVKYRNIRTKEKDYHQLVFNKTPFYPEAGGQVGDTGTIRDLKTGTSFRILNTRYENQLIVHFAETLPPLMDGAFLAVVDHEARRSTARNHSATHLLHLALREILGPHVEQKGSLVHPDYFRFDFSHFRKMTPEEITATERMVNGMILNALDRDEKREVPLAEAKNMGAVSLFGEKYGEKVRVIRFGDSVELCGGTHVHSTGEIGLFKILSESAIAAGIRRIEAITGATALAFYEEQLNTVNQIRELVRNPRDPVKGVQQILEKNAQLEEELKQLTAGKALADVNKMLSSATEVSGIRFVGASTDLKAGDMKDMAFHLRETEQNLVVVLASEPEGKAGIAIFVSPDLTRNRQLSAIRLVKEVATLIQGGGGGQDFFATAGGKNIAALPAAIEKVKEILGKS